MTNRNSHHIQNFLRKLGFPDSDSAVFTTLFLSGKPLTAEELSGMTGYSAASISLSLMRLRKHHLVNKAREGGRNVYWPAKSLVENFNLFVRDLLEEHIRPFLQTVADEGDDGMKQRILSDLRRLERSLKSIVEGGVIHEQGGDIH